MDSTHDEDVRYEEHMMTGKVFPNSANVYEDQAAVLFDYYRKAAERIIREEQEVEQRIAKAEDDHESADRRAASARRLLIVFAAAAVLSLVILLVAGLGPIALLPAAGCAALAVKQYLSLQLEQERIDMALQELAELELAYRNIRRDYQVDRIGVVYVPVAQRTPVANGTLVVDYTGDQPDTEFSLTVLNQPGELKDAMQTLRTSVEEMPAVETDDEVEQVDTSAYSTSVQDVTLYDYTGSIDRQVRNVRYLVGDSHDVSVSIPAVAPASERYEFLSEYATDDPSGYPVVPIYDTRDIQHKVDEFVELGDLNERAVEDSSGDVTFFADVMRQLAQGIDMLSRSRTESVTRLTNYTSSILVNVLKASYDQYSPTLEAEEIERIRTATFNYADEVGSYEPFSLKSSSRVRYDIFADTWVADNGARTAMPFGMHQVDTEVLMPVISNLMQENRKERLRIYNEIQDQKIHYLNQWHRETDDFYGRNRTEANALIQRMSEIYAEYIESYTNYKQQSATFKTMKDSGNLDDAEVEEARNQDEIIAGFQLQASQAHAKQDEFASFMERIRDDIEQSAERFAHVEYYEASLRDSQARDVARAIAGVRDLDVRRRSLAPVSAYLAQSGDVPPEPQVSEQLGEDFTINLNRQAEQEIASLDDDGVDGGARQTEGANA